MVVVTTIRSLEKDMSTVDIFKEIVNSISAQVAIIDSQGVILETNQAWQDFAKDNGMPQGFHSIGLNYLSICDCSPEQPDDDPAKIAQGIRSVINGELAEFITHYPCHSPEKKRWFVLRVVPFRKAGDEKFIITHENVTPLMLAQEELKEKEQELLFEREKLEETNIALRVLLRQRDEDKSRIEETVYTNAEQLVLPYVEKLKLGKLSEKQRLLIEIVDNNLKDIISPFLKSLSNLGILLTPQETEVANLVRDGRSTKEIAEIMGLSTSGVEFHRKRLRKKFGLTNSSKNLRSFLLTIMK